MYPFIYPTDGYSHDDKSYNQKPQLQETYGFVTTWCILSTPVYESLVSNLRALVRIDIRNSCFVTIKWLYPIHVP